MVHLVVAIVLALWLALPAPAALGVPWRPVYIHLLVLGWATQMIFGVSWWMFPRKQPLDLTAVPWLGWVCFGALNLGLVVRAAAEPVLAVRVSALASAGAVLAALLQLVAVASYVWLVWPRVMRR